MPVATPSERMKRDLAISSRRQPCTKPRIIRSKKRIDPIEIAKEPPRPTRRLINKQIGDLARINRMPALNDTPPHHQPRQVQPRHQLNGSPRIPPRNRDERRHQAHQIPQRPRKNNQHQPNRTRTLLNAHHRDNSLSPRPLFLRVIQTLCHSERSEESRLFTLRCAFHPLSRRERIEGEGPYSVRASRAIQDSASVSLSAARHLCVIPTEAEGCWLHIDFSRPVRSIAVAAALRQQRTESFCAYPERMPTASADGELPSSALR